MCRLFYVGVYLYALIIEVRWLFIVCGLKLEICMSFCE